MANSKSHAWPIIIVIIIVIVIIGCLLPDDDSSSSRSSSSSSSYHTCDYCGKSGAQKYDCYVGGNYWKTMYLCSSDKSTLLSNGVTMKRVD